MQRELMLADCNCYASWLALQLGHDGPPICLSAEHLNSYLNVLGGLVHLLRTLLVQFEVCTGRK